MAREADEYRFEWPEWEPPEYDDESNDFDDYDDCYYDDPEDNDWNGFEIEDGE